VGPADLLRDTQRAFDGVAASYERSNAENRLLSAMRTRTRRVFERFVPAGSRVLDLGCGTGSDVEHFARRGDRVTAVDWSPAMVAETERRVRAAGLAGRVVAQHLGIHQIDCLAPGAFDAAHSSFGPLNCVADLPDIARQIANRLRPGGVLVASVIGRVCPWEIALYLARGNWRRATLRFSNGMVPVPLEGRTVWMEYHSPRTFEAAFVASRFSRVLVRSLGLCAPPPYLQAFADRHPTAVDRLARVDDLVGSWPGLCQLGDHFLIVLRKAPSPTGQRAKG
jgi:SAM-dependent methyltransferase